MPNLRVLAQIVFGILIRTNLHDFRKFAKTTVFAKFEMVITEKLCELQP